MKKSVGSFLALNRNLIIVLAVMLGVAGSGLISWQASAQNDSPQNNSQDAKNSAAANASSVTSRKRTTAAPRAQTDVRGMFRGVQTAVQFDVSPPLRTMVGTPARTEPKRSKFEELHTGNEGALGFQDIDQTVQMLVGDSPNGMPTPIVSFDSGIGCGTCQPPDPNGDVGPNHFVAMGNLQFQIFNKTGTSLFGPVNTNTLWAGFGGACQTQNAGDPIVIYDQLDDRWILTQFTAGTAPFFNCVAVSTSPDPTGTYFRYAFTTGNNFPDYPKYGMWSDALYISTREFAGGTGGSFAGVGAYAVNREQLIAGNPAAQLISFLASPAGSGGAFNVGDGLVPTDLDGAQLPPSGSPNFFIGSMDQGGPYAAPEDALTIWKFTANFVTPANSTFALSPRVPIAGYDTVPAFCSGRSCVPQPGTTGRIDHLGYRQRPLFRAAYRNFGSHESIVTNQSVEASATMSGIRWWEIRSPNSSPVIHQEGTYAPGLTDNIHRWMGSIAMDTVGNIALGFSASSDTATNVFPSSWYTGRLAGDPPGTMPQGEGVIVNGAGVQSGQRWGDYTDMVVDSVDDCTFWYTNEYIPAGGTWRMRIGSFKFPNCLLGPNFSLSVTPSSQAVCAPANAVYTVNTTSISGFTDPVTLSATGNPAGTTVTFSPNPVVPGNSSTMTITNTGAAAAGTYTINVLGTSGPLTQNQNVTLILSNGVPAVPILVSPANGSTTTGLTPTFTWNAASGAITYEIQVATDAAFTNVVASATGLTTTSWTSNVGLSQNTPYFWRVRAVNACGNGAYSSPFSFTTPCLSTYVEAEPNNTSGTAQNLSSNNQIELVGSVGVAQDQDFYQFNANAGDRVWSYAYTLGATTSTDSQLTLFDPVGAVIQFDDINGSQATAAAAIAGAPLAASGAHQVRVAPFSTTATINPYTLFLTRTSGASIPEAEPNETLPTANAYTVGTVVSGAVTATTDIDTYSFNATASERMVIQVDGDPERDATSTTVGQLNPNFRIVNDAGTTLVTVDSDGTTCSTNCPAGTIIRRSESHLFTFPAAGTYYIQVISDVTGPTTGTYSMHVWRPTGPTCGSPTPTPTGTPASPTSTNTRTATSTPTATSTVAATSTGTPAPTCTPAVAPYVVPPAYTATTGTSTFTGPLANAARTYQLLIHANQLTGIVGQPIAGLNWRLPAAATGTWPAADVSFANYDIRLSGSVDPANRSLTDFSANVVGAQTLVRSGPLSITAGSYTSGGSPNAFGPDIAFNTPWIYTGGNLLIELRHDGFAGTSRSVDGLGTATAGYGTDFSAAWTGSYTGTSGTQGNFSVARLVTGGSGCPSPSGTPANTATSTATATRTSTATATATNTATATPPPPSPTPSESPSPSPATVQFSSATYVDDESQTAVITITRSLGSGSQSVNFATSDGSATGGAACTSGVDYINTAASVFLSQGVPSATVNIPLCPDSLAEPTQTVNLTLSGVTGGALGSPSIAVLSINDTANAIRNGASICTTFGGNGVPYPSTITVSTGPASIGSMRVTLYDVTHSSPDSMDFLLVGPGGQNIMLMGDAGGNVDLTTPVTLTFADSAGQVLPDSSPLTTGTFEATTWIPGQASFAAPAPPAPYNQPGSTVGGTPSLLSVFGTTNSNGVWSLYMRDDAGTLTAITGCANGGWGLELLGSTAANAAISGRVTTADGLGIRNARVIITGNSLGEPLIATTASFGYFTFEGLPTGETYVVTVNARRYTFNTPSQVISLVDNVIDADFIAEPQE